MATQVKFRIGNLEPSTKADDVSTLLAIPPEREDIQLQLEMNEESGECKGFGFLTVPDDEADKYLNCSGLKLNGKVVVISRSNGENAPKKTVKQHKKHGRKHRPPPRWGSAPSGGRGVLPFPHGAPCFPPPSRGPGYSMNRGVCPIHNVRSYHPRPYGPGGDNQMAQAYDGPPGEKTGKGKKKGYKRQLEQQDTAYASFTANGQHGDQDYGEMNRQFACFSIARGGPMASNIPYRYSTIDIGANLTHNKYKGDLIQVIQRATLSGVRNIIITGLHVRGSQHALEMSKMHPGYLYCTAGMHPHDAKTWNTDTIDALEKVAMSPECVAIGECGLDYNRMFSPKEKQLEVFEKQVQLACRIQKPLFVHEREAHEDCIAVLNKYCGQLPPVVVHCFTGNREAALTYIGLGFYLGLTGFLWKDKTDNGVRRLLADNDIPLDKLMLETDSPFMYPHVERGGFPDHVLGNITGETAHVLGYCQPTRNEPCAMPMVVELVAGCLGKSSSVVAELTTINALRFFGIPK